MILKKRTSIMNNDKYHINIANDFTISPGGRYRKDGDHSGEEFCDDYLLPRVKEAITEAAAVTVDLDGTIGYGSSFLDEAFGGLQRKLKKEGKTAIGFIRLLSARRPHLIPIIEGIMNDVKDTDGN